MYPQSVNSKMGAVSSTIGKKRSHGSGPQCLEGYLREFMHVRQAFPDDGGKTWEVNWIAGDTRSPDRKLE